MQPHSQTKHQQLGTSQTLVQVLHWGKQTLLQPVESLTSFVSASTKLALPHRTPAQQLNPELKRYANTLTVSDRGQTHHMPPQLTSMVGQRHKRLCTHRFNSYLPVTSVQALCGMQHKGSPLINRDGHGVIVDPTQIHVCFYKRLQT